MRTTAIITLALSSLLTACGSDDGGSSNRLPSPPAGFGENNSLTAFHGTWEQECSPIEGNLAKRQSVVLDGNNITFSVRDYSDSSCTNLTTKNVYFGKYQEYPATTSKGDEVFPIEVIYTRSTSTAYSEPEVKARNLSRLCERTDWAQGVEIDVSNWNSCFPLFDIPDRQHFRFLRNQQGDLFMDDRSKGNDPQTGYPNQLDRVPFQKISN